MKTVTEITAEKKEASEIRLAAYCRVSSGSADQRHSFAAQQESLAISGNVRWSYRKRMASGEFNCTYPAYGFRLIDGKLQINETEAAVVRRIFALYLQGLGRQAIADVLNQEGIRTRREGKQWRATGISYLLGNERYVSDALLQKKYTTQSLPEFLYCKSRGN